MLILSQVKSPFIVKLYETFADELDICFVFEYLEGKDLYKVAKKHRGVLMNYSNASGDKNAWVKFYAAEII